MYTAYGVPSFYHSYCSAPSSPTCWTHPLPSPVLLNSPVVWSPTGISEAPPDPPPAQRHAGVIKLKPEMYDQYTQLHDKVWPQVLDAMHRHNIRNFAVWYHPTSSLLFHSFDYVGDDLDSDMEELAKDPPTRFWWSLCEPCQEPFDWDGPPPSQGGKGSWWSPLTLLCHCGGWPTRWARSTGDPSVPPRNPRGATSTYNTPPTVHNRTHGEVQPGDYWCKLATSSQLAGWRAAGALMGSDFDRMDGFLHGCTSRPDGCAALCFVATNFFNPKMNSEPMHLLFVPLDAVALVPVPACVEDPVTDEYAPDGPGPVLPCIVAANPHERTTTAPFVRMLHSGCAHIVTPPGSVIGMSCVSVHGPLVAGPDGPVIPDPLPLPTVTRDVHGAGDPA